MKNISKKLVVLLIILAFLFAFIGAAQARTYYYLDTLPEFVNAPVIAPFDGSATGSGTVTIGAIDSNIANTDGTLPITITL